jgi:rifampicin phosphotransferase
MALVPLNLKTAAARVPDADPSVLGGKGAGLARLVALGLPVPPAVVVPVTDEGRVFDPDRLLDRLPEPFAVRSSAPTEDAGDRSAAGQYESLIGVAREALDEAVRTVHASASSERVRAYRGDGPSAMAVVIQHAVPASRAGVAFSRDPVGGRDAVVIECVFGHGEGLVSGRVAPDRFVVESDGTVRARLAAKDDDAGRQFHTLRTLRDDEAVDLARLVRTAGEGFGHPVDIEFCLDGPTPWLVQCRAITALGPSSGSSS